MTAASFAPTVSEGSRSNTVPAAGERGGVAEGAVETQEAWLPRPMKRAASNSGRLAPERCDRVVLDGVAGSDRRERRREGKRSGPSEPNEPHRVPSIDKAVTVESRSVV